MINLNDKDRKELSRKYGRVVKTVEFYNGGVAADVFLDKATMMLSAHLNDKFNSSKDGKLVERWLENEIRKAVELIWQPVIAVLDLGNDGGSGSYNYCGRQLELHCVNLDVHRFYAAVLPDGDIRAVDWDVSEKARLTTHSQPSVWTRQTTLATLVKDGAICLPLHDDTTHILPYSEPVWLGFQELLKGIDRLRGKINELIMTDAGLKKLAEAGNNFSRMLEDTKQ